MDQACVMLALAGARNVRPALLMLGAVGCQSCALAKNFLAQSSSFNRPARLESAGRALKPRAKPTAWDEVCTARMSASASWRRLFTHNVKCVAFTSTFKNQTQMRVNYITVRLASAANESSIRSCKPPDQRL
jgi:hypothetical protein